MKQDSIPVGCVLPTCQPSGVGGDGKTVKEGYDPGGYSLWVGMAQEDMVGGCTVSLPPVDRQTSGDQLVWIENFKNSQNKDSRCLHFGFSTNPGQQLSKVSIFYSVSVV